MRSCEHIKALFDVDFEYLMVIVGVGAIGEFDAGVRAGKLPSTWYP